jgi:hypothetical protein
MGRYRFCVGSYVYLGTVSLGIIMAEPVTQQMAKRISGYLSVYFI